MKNTILSFSLLFCTVCIFGQVGVNTSNPQTSFHVDGGKDNADTGIPTIPQQNNDVVVSQSGNVGLGLINPSTKLDINNGTVAGAVKIQDGTQGEDKVLTSNADGVATWQTPASFKFSNVSKLAVPNWGITYGPTTRLTIINGPVVNNVNNGLWIRGFIEISRNGTTWITISEAISVYASSVYLPCTLTAMIPIGWYYRTRRESTALGWNSGHIYELY